MLQVVITRVVLSTRGLQSPRLGITCQEAYITLIVITRVVLPTCNLLSPEKGIN